MTISGRAIVCGKRECVLVKEGSNFQLVVVSDDSWQDTGTAPLAHSLHMFTISSSMAFLWMMLKDCPTETILKQRLMSSTGLDEIAAAAATRCFLDLLEKESLISYTAHSSLEKRSPYELALGSTEAIADGIVFNKDGLTIEPVCLALQSEAISMSSPDSGYAQPSDPGCSGPGCLICC